MNFGDRFFSATHEQREYEKRIASLLCTQDFSFSESDINSFTPEETARAGYFLELSLKIAKRCGIEPPEFLSDMIAIARQKLEKSSASNIRLFDQWVPGFPHTLGKRWRLTHELVLKNVESEVMRWMIRSGKGLSNF